MEPRIFYPARLSFKIEGEIKSFPVKQKLEEFMTSPARNFKGGFFSEKIQNKSKISKATKTRKDQGTPPETPTLQSTQWH